MFKMNIPICCIKCEKPIDTWKPSDEGFCFVDKAVRFGSHGNYGSDVCDMHPHEVEIYLCDACFIHASQNKMLIDVVETKSHTTTSYQLHQL